MSSRAPSGLFLGLFQFVSVLAAGAQGAAPPVIPVDQHGDRLPPGALGRFGTVRLRHTGLAALAFSPEGNRLFSLGATNLGAELRLWDLAGGKLLGQRPLPIDRDRPPSAKGRAGPAGGARPAVTPAWGKGGRLSRPAG
jgi:hypothetical protein